jgi:hypothetical protein
MAATERVSPPAGGVSRRERAVVALAFALFTLLAWGLLAPDRGYLQDEPWILAALRDGRAGALGFLWPAHTLALTPQRPLQGLPFALALLTPWPRLALQITFGAAWLVSGVAAARLVARLRPGRPLAAFAAGSLVLTATGDHAVDNLAYLTAYVAAAAFLVALASLAAWERDGSRRSLAAALAALAFGLLTYDGIVAAAVAAPALMWGLGDAAREPPGTRRRRAAGSAAWCAVLLPYLALFAYSLRSAGSYAERNVERLAAAEWLARAARLFTLNFTPWRWSGLFVRPEDGTRAALLPAAWLLALTAAGTLVFVAVGLRLARRAAPASPAPAGWAARALGSLLLAAALANGAVALVTGVPHRTQIASRLFASLALALAADLAAERLERARSRLALLPWALPAVFVGFGLAAGLVSQDYHLTLWRRHRAELRSILDRVPGLKDDAWMLLRVPAGAPFTSFYYPEVGGPWLDHLYGAPPRAVIWQPRGRMACSLAVGAFVCRDRRRAECYASGACDPLVVPVERAVLLDHVPSSGGFELRRRLPLDVLAEATAPAVAAAEARYAPEACVVPRPRTRAALELLDTPELLGRWLPGAPR